MLKCLNGVRSPTQTQITTFETVQWLVMTSTNVVHEDTLGMFFTRLHS